jgi:basic amino acid/polyamine antiporter, APA family
LPEGRNSRSLRRMKKKTETAAEGQLIRALGVPGLTANIVNATIGAGIFAWPATVAAQIGAASPLAYVICGVEMCLFVTSFAMAGSRVSLTGGLYAYVEVAFGRYLGFVAGVLYFLTAILAISGIVALIASSLSALIPALAGPLGRVFIIVFVFLLLTTINIRGVRAGARAVEGLTIIKLAPLLIFVLAGLFFLNPQALAWPGWPRSDLLGRSVLQLLFAFVGVEVALVPSGEINNPARTVPLAIFTALGITTLLYIMIQLVALGVMGDQLGKYGDTALAEAASRFLGNGGRLLMLVGLVVSAFGFAATDILSSPRIIYAFGRDRFLPHWFGRVHPRFHTPHVAIISYAIMGFALSFWSTFQKLAVLSNTAVLLLYILCCLAALQLKRRDVRGDGVPFGFPGATVVPIAAIGVIIWILAHATIEELVITGGCVAVASVLFLIREALSRRAGRSAEDAS